MKRCFAVRPAQARGPASFTVGGVSQATGPLPPTRCNPSGLTTNCGFCAVSWALQCRKNVTLNADQLYVQTLERLGLPVDQETDPVPRMLIFPGARLEDNPIRASYEALAHTVHGLSGYTITSVAEAHDLKTRHGNRELLQLLVDYYARMGPATWTIDDFVRARLNQLRAAGQNPSLRALRIHVANELGGDSIIGSKTVNHFVNLSINASGGISAYDAQDGRTYDGRGLKARLNTIDLFLRIV